MFDAKPEDRNTFALFILNIETDHKSVEGNLVAVDRITFGKKGSPNYQQTWDVKRLRRDDPSLWRVVEPVYENWKKTQTIATEGHPLEAWPAITKGQLKAYKDLGLRSVEDIAVATDSTRERMGMGALEVIRQAKAFLASKNDSATAAKVADLEAQIAQLIKDGEEARKTIDSLMAERGKAPKKPKFEKEAA